MNGFNKFIFTLVLSSAVIIPVVDSQTSSLRLSSFDNIAEEEGYNNFNRLLAPVQDAGYSSRIINGNDADQGEYPWFVSIIDRFLCGGVLISSRYVLTAASCGNRTDADMYIGAYKFSSTEGGAQLRKCEQWIADPRYENEGTDGDFDIEPYQFDYALCKLDTPVEISDTQVKLVLNTDNEFPPPGTDATIIGIGLISVDPIALPNTLQEAVIPTIPNNSCDINGNRPANICASDLTEPPDDRKITCDGDSGGPLFLRLNNGDGTFKDVHFGVASFGDPGCVGQAVYGRTSFGIDWIKSVVCEDPDGQDADFCEGITRSECTNDPDFKVKRKKCKGYLRRRRKKKCKKIIAGKLVAVSCPSLCKRFCPPCRNKSGKLRLENGRTFNCKMIKNNGKCNSKTKVGPLAKYFCPVACNVAGC